MSKAHKPAAVAVSTSRYLASHGKEPRGFGLWIFENAAGKPVHTESGFYAEVKAEARKAAARADFLLIFAAP